MSYSGQKISIGKLVTSDGQTYENVVKLDASIFNGVSEDNKKERLVIVRNYLYKHEGLQMTVFDEQGNEELIELAKRSDKAKRKGAKDKGRVLNKMAGTRIIAKQMAIANITVVAKVSSKIGEANNNEHGWLDNYGWDYRRSYVVSPSNELFSMTLNIARGNERNILYDITHVKKEAEGVFYDSNSTSDNNIPSSNTEHNNLSE